MKRKFLLLCFLVFSMCSLCVNAENEHPGPEQELPAAKPEGSGPVDTLPQKRSGPISGDYTEKEIMRILELQDQYFAAKENEVITNKFSEIPKTGNGEYTLGKFKEETLDNATSYLNYLRNLAYLSPVAWTEGKVNFAQHGAVGMAAVRMQSHYIAQEADKPENMSDSFWQQAGQGALYSCLHSSYFEESLLSHLDSYMYDYGVNNTSVGHRAYLLSKHYKTVGFGYAQTTPVISGEVNYYTSTSFQNENGNTVSNDFITSWPSSGVFPTNQVYTDLRWSVHLNNSGYGLNEDNVKVILKNTATDQTWEFSNANADGEFTLANSYGYRTIVFRPENISYSAGQEFTVTVTGITGTSNSYSYTTKLFDINEEYKIPDTAYVRNEDEFQEALDNAKIIKIILANDIQLTKPLEVKRNTVITANREVTVTSGASGRHMNITGTDITMDFPDSMVTLSGNDISGGIQSRAESLHIKNAIIRNCAATSGGALRVYQKAIIENCVIKENTSSGSGGGISGGNLVITGNTQIMNNTASGSGGGIYASTDLTLQGGKICRNTASEGSGVYFNSGTFTMSDGEISDNSTSIYTGHGGAVYSNGTFIMEDGSIKNNVGSTTVYLRKGSFTMENGLISDNLARNSGGGVYVYYDTVFTMKNGTITNNTALSTYGGGVFNASSFIMEDGEITNNIAGSYGGGVGTSGYQAAFTMKNGKISGNSTSSEQYGRGGGVYGDITMEDGEISNNTATHYGNAVYAKSFFMKSGKIYGNRGSDYCIYTDDFTMENGKITNNAGRSVHVNTGTFIMENGQISGGANIGVSIFSGTFIMNNGKITNHSGSGVYVGPSSVYTMNGGEITGNTATNGGGVYISGTFTMNDGIIANNTAEHNGGGIFADRNAIYIYKGGNVSGNTAGEDGDDIFIK